MSSALLGCIFGALISGWCADKLGRKLPLILSAVLFSASAWGRRSPSFRYVCGLPHCGRSRDWSGFALSRFTLPKSVRQRKRAFCRGQSAHHRDWRTGAQLINLMIAEPWTGGDATDDCGQLEWADGLALDVRCGTGAGAGVSGPDVFCPRVAALAHEGR